MVKQNVKNILELILMFICNAFRALPHIAKNFFVLPKSIKFSDDQKTPDEKTPDQSAKLISSACKKSVRSRTYGEPRNVYALSGYQ
jgi:hypothetical protein